jgi:uroporphyrinogen III methyltransferase / synthase
MPVGTVFLVGAGPGDPKLLTLGGKQALSLADIVVYDRLVHPSLLNHCRSSAERIYVGKQAGRHTLTQDKINLLLSDSALAGKTVVRLKGGDPFVFGRGGEEAEHLRDLDIPFVVIPGVTSAIAAAAYAGIPVTHRDASSSFAVITGHERANGRESGDREPGVAEERRRWDKIAGAADTLIFLMGVESLPEITHQLIENGREATTPVALVRWGTWAGRQETITGTLGTIAAEVARTGFKAPAVTVVGDVVNWRSRLQWFDNRPLSGKRILVTRAREQQSSLVDILTSEFAEPIEFPTIRIVEPTEGHSALDGALQALGKYDWVIFTSANAVKTVFDRLEVKLFDARAFAGVKIAAVGPATAEELLCHGILADFIPRKFTGEDIANDFPAQATGLNILLPQAKDANGRLAEVLTSNGAAIDVVTAYETVVESSLSADISALLEDGEIDVVTFTSSSTVRNFFSALGRQSGAGFPKLLTAAIGPSTAQTVKELFGREPDIVADEHTVVGLVEALKLYFSGSK